MASRFERELEFIQLICNPEYIRWLYNERYFEKREFIDFLKYLDYFKNEKYRKCLTYPQCLIILELLQKDDINTLLAEDSFYSKLAEDQYNLWKNRI